MTQTDKQAHTPGPWFHDHNHAYVIAVTSPRRVGKVTVTHGYEGVAGDFPALGIGGKGQAEFEANARLIAAAPELLKACQEATAYYEMLEHATGVEHGVLKTLRDTIAKAKGQS